MRTTTDVVVTIVQDLDRALMQAPASRLRVQAEATDWDAELVALGDGVLPGEPPNADDEATDPEVENFRMLHAQLHEAARAVLAASGGRVRVFE